jgi:hypothetical protein
MKQYTAEEYEKLPDPTEIEITGPYHYAHEIHPSFRLETKGFLPSQDRIFACIYVIDGDVERARREAELIVDVMRLGRRGLDNLHYAVSTAE